MKPSPPTGRPTFFEGGWVLLGAVALLLAVLIWALTPAVLRMVDRPPGDGRNPATYGFNLDTPRVPEAADIRTAMLHRDMVPVLDAPPGILQGSEVVAAVDSRNQYLVSSDAVIGVTIDGHHRAYPIRMLHIHEVVHDELAGVPIAVTWHWPSASPRVFDRRSNGEVLRLGVSGLVAGGTQLLYPRNNDEMPPPLVSQWSGHAVTGPDRTLTSVPLRLVSWADWMESHPDTTVIAEDVNLEKRYDKGDPNSYYRSRGLLFELPGPPPGNAPKAPVAILSVGSETMLLAANAVQAADGPLEVMIGGHQVIAQLGDRPPRIEVLAPPEVQVRQGLWHAAAAMDAAATQR